MEILGEIAERQAAKKELDEDQMTPVDERLTDKEFKKKLPSMSAPEWAGQSYLRCMDDSSDEDDEGSSDGESEEDLSA
ncbi:hypothetical protein L916_18881 [Phytophthora nicotianae]|uniref:Uncharacterized protein n=2 Tax=Phytophthora nicotianae TaxID=4792 RepID=W2I096_PHYNI|nr:hypothetical protein L916_18881 [Phytophthora nicotianae]